MEQENINRQMAERGRLRNLELAKKAALSGLAQQGLPGVPQGLLDIMATTGDDLGLLSPLMAQQRQQQADAAAMARQQAQIAARQDAADTAHMRERLYGGEEGVDLTTAGQKYNEMLKLGVPEEVARGAQYGTLRTVSNPNGGAMIIDITTNRPIGAMQPKDPSKPYGEMEWVDLLGKGGQAPAPQGNAVGKTTQPDGQYTMGGKNVTVRNGVVYQ